MRLLLVDHAPAFRETLAAALAYALDATVTEAATDTAALAALENSEPVACVLVDLHIPDLGGLELCRRVRARGGPPVVVMTAHERALDREEAREAGAAGFVDKTRGLVPVLDAIRAVL